MADRLADFFDDNRGVKPVHKTITKHAPKNTAALPTKKDNMKPVTNKRVTPNPKKKTDAIEQRMEFDSIVRDVRSLVFNQAGKNKKAETKKGMRQFEAAKILALGGQLEKGVGHGYKHFIEMRQARNRKMEAAKSLGTDQVTATKQWYEPQEVINSKKRSEKAKIGRKDAAMLTAVGRVPSHFKKHMSKK